MKKLLSFIVLLSFLGFVQVLEAQNDAKAAEILKKVEASYESFNQIQGLFTMSVENKDLGISERKKGRVAMKGDKYRLETDEYEVVCNGTTVWTYFKQDFELLIDNYDPEESEMSPVRLFTIYKEDYSAEFVEEVKAEGATLQYVDLFPNDVDNQYSRIRISVNKASGMIVSAKVYSRNGTSYTISIDQQGTDTPLTNDDFEFDTTDLDEVEITDFR